MSWQLQAQAELELRKRKQAGDDPFAQFQAQYRDDPVAFVHDCIDWDRSENGGPAPYQDKILSLLNDQKRVAVRSPHGAGKTALTTWAILWFALTRDVAEEWKIPATASAWRQLTKFLFPELALWMRRLRWDKIGRRPFDTRTEALALSLKLHTGESFALASDNSALIEGAHSKNLLYIFDESRTIPDATWDSAEGAFATGDTRWLAVSTPGQPQGRFYDIHSRKPGTGDWVAIHITLDEAIAAGRVSAEWAAQRKEQWGERSAVYQNRVLGEFCAGAIDGVIPLAWVEAAMARWQEWDDSGRSGIFTGVGVDVGGGGLGGDKTVLAICFDNVKVAELRKYERADPATATMEVVGRVAGVLKMQGNGEAMVDVIGIGAGVVHRLRELGYPVRAFNAAKSTDFLDISGELGFANWRAAAWWVTREMLEPSSGFDVCLPPDDELTGDLVAPTSRIVSGRGARGGFIQIESKESIKRRLRRSTDCGDAVVQILVGPALCDEEAAQGQETEQVIYQPVRIGPY